MLNMHQRWEKGEIGIPPGCPRATSMMAHIGTILDPRTSARGMNVHFCADPSTQDDEVDLLEEGEGENVIDGALGRTIRDQPAARAGAQGCLCSAISGRHVARGGAQGR